MSSLMDCPECEAHARSSLSIEEDRFPYGEVWLTALVIVHTCPACQFRWTDGLQDERRDAEIKRYLKGRRS